MSYLKPQSTSFVCGLNLWRNYIDMFQNRPPQRQDAQYREARKTQAPEETGLLLTLS